MTVHAGPGSLRDRIARFETTDIPSASKPPSPIRYRLKPAVNGTTTTGNQSSNIPASSGTSPTQTMSITKTPVTPLAASKLNAKDSKVAEEKKASEAVLEEPPEGQVVDAAPSSLDALLSPITSDSQDGFSPNPAPDSQRDDEDDVRFSTVPLSGNSFDDDGKCEPTFGSFSSIHGSIHDSSPAEQEGQKHGYAEDDSTADSTTLNTFVSDSKKDSVSSLSSVPFLINRLDKQEEMSDLTLGANRQLQEEFTRLQKQKADPATEAEAGQIDWGQRFCFIL